METEFKCPVCGAELLHNRIDDGEILNRITRQGVVEEICNDSNGFDLVYCSLDKYHKLPDKLVEKVLNLVQ